MVHRELETGRLLLRRVRLEDAKDLYAYASDPEVTAHLTWDAHTSIAQTEGFIRYLLAANAQDWVMVLKCEGRVVGSCGFVSIDGHHACGQLGYVLARAYWGQGLAAEAVTRIIRFAFEEMGLNRVEAVHRLPNLASGAVMRKAGMKQEGTLRQRIFAKGAYHDVLMYAIVKSDLG